MASASGFLLVDKPTGVTSFAVDVVAHVPTSAKAGTVLPVLAYVTPAGGQPAEAKRIYEQVQKENPASAVAQLAQEKLQALNKPATAQ